jgi:hypothetical protein
MLKTGVNFITGILLLATSIFCFNFNDSLNKISYGLLISVIIEMVIEGIENRKILHLWFQSFHPFRFLKPIRISIAYLFRIEIDGRYLLIKNHRGQNGYQPIGGVYKYFKNETASYFQKIGLISDTKITVDGDSRNDLRCNLKHRYKLFKFLKWLKLKTDRETDPWREFYEELVEPGYLSSQAFPYIQYNLTGTNYSKIKYSEIFRIDEFLYADIFEIKFITHLQEQEIRGLLNIANNEFLFATAEEIKSGKSGNHYILPHSEKIL